MNSIKGIYHDGIIEPIVKPKIDMPTEVIIIFPDRAKGITKIGGLFKKSSIDYTEIEKDLKELSRKSEENISNKEL